MDQRQFIGEEQVCFRKGYGTNDHIFVLKSIIDLYLSKKRNLYAVFVDYKTAFDKINRTALWHKIINSGINGKIFRIIFNLYLNAHSCLINDGILSEPFPCATGVRQGENLSPLLFAIFVNDLQKHISEKYGGLEFISKLNEQLGDHAINDLLKLYLLLYADDTVILAESPEQLQNALDGLLEYCNRWKLTVNTAKTKTVVFSRGKKWKYPEFTFEGSKVELVFEYVYLGVKFSFNGQNTHSCKYAIEKGSKAMFNLYRKVKEFDFPLDLSLHLFKTLVLPVLMHESQVWGTLDHIDIEKIQLKYCRYILNIYNSTPSVMIYGELGIYPLEIEIICGIVGLWFSIISGKQSKLSYVM